MVIDILNHFIRESKGDLCYVVGEVNKSVWFIRVHAEGTMAVLSVYHCFGLTLPDPILSPETACVLNGSGWIMLMPNTQSLCGCP